MLFTKLFILKNSISIMKLPELHQLLKLHKIKGISHLNKPELIAELTKRGILPEEPESVDQGDVPTIYKAARAYSQPLIAYYNGRVWRIVKSIEQEHPKKEPRLTSIKQPRPVEILDRDTGEVAKYPSIYKAARAYGQCSTMIAYYNGRVWKNRYEIKVCDPIADGENAEVSVNEKDAVA